MSTAHDQTVPGWWIEMQASVLRQLPRPGEIDVITAQGWTDNQRALKKVLKKCLVPPDLMGFSLSADFGIITVPKGYVHESCLARFRDEGCVSCQDYITDQNYAKPTRILRPGDKLRVRAFTAPRGVSTSAEQWMDFLRTERAVFTGAQGLSLVIQQKLEQLSKERYYVSFDDPYRLCQVNQDFWVPVLGTLADQQTFNLGSFGGKGGFGGDHVFALCFTDVEVDES